MKVGILVPSIGAFGQKGFYNIQEAGYAKELERWCESVIVYKLVDKTQKAAIEIIKGSNNAKIQFIPSSQIGSNGLPDLKLLDRQLDALILCGDTQLSVPAIAYWAKRNHVRLIPYIGVAESHSTSYIKKKLMNLLFRRNLSVYKKHHCLAKTPAVKAVLEQKGISQITVAPVGLDLSLMREAAEQEDFSVLKGKYGFLPTDKVLLFIGRLCDEKQPIKMVELFNQISRKHQEYKLLMVGSGELAERIDQLIKQNNLSEKVVRIDRIPNSEIWELYRIADCFVNLNHQEIFGMAILEAMYYGCKVVAWHAPGPDFIIEDGISGFLASSDDEVIAAICEKTIVPENATNRVLRNFTWETTARKIYSIISES